MTQQNRRQFLRNSAVAGTGFAAAVTGCSNKTTPQPAADQKKVAQAYQAQADETAKDNLFNVLSRYDFKDQNGETLNVDALKTSMKDQFSTMVFGKSDCEEYCPMINSRISALGEINPNLASIVICANPETDGQTQESRDKLLSQIRAAGVKHKVIILYPTDKQGNLNNAIAPEITAESHEIVNRTNPENHGTKILLHAPGGNEVAKMSSTETPDKFQQTWKPIMDGERIR